MFRKLLVTGILVGSTTTSGYGREVQKPYPPSYIVPTQEQLDHCWEYETHRLGGCIIGTIFNQDYSYVQYCIDNWRTCGGVPTIEENYWNNLCGQWSGSNLTYGQMQHRQEMCLLHECVSTDWPDIYHTQIRYTLKCED